MNEIIGEEFTALEMMVDITIPEGTYRDVAVNYLMASQDE